MNIFIPTLEQMEVTSMVWLSDCEFRRCVGKNPKRVYLSQEALQPFGACYVLDCETDMEINGLPVFFDSTLRGKSCYCRI